VLWLRGETHGELPGLRKVEGGEGGPCKASARQGPKSINTGHPVAPKAQRARPSAEQMDLGEG
jgi:hypothetical protein